MNLPEIKNKLRFGLPMLPLYEDVPAVAWLQKKEIFGKHNFYSHAISLMSEGGSKGEVILDKDEYLKVWNWSLKNYELLQKEYNIWIKKRDIFFDRVNNCNFNDLKTLKELYLEYVKLYSIASITDGCLVGSEIAAKKLKEKYNLINEEVAFLLGPKKKPFLLENKEDLIKLAMNFPEEVNNINELKEKNLDFFKKIEKHILNYHWITNNYKNITYLDEYYFFEKIKVLKNKSRINEELKKLQEFEKKNYSKKNDLIKKIEIDHESLNEINISEFLGDWTDERKALNMLGNYLMFKFAEHCSNILKISREDTELFIYDEIISFIQDNKIDNKEIEKRKEGIIITRSDNKFQIISGKKAKEIIEKLSLQSEDINIIEGTVASQGKIIGKVRIIHDPFKEVLNKGEILVTSMTRPDFVPLMDKAAGFITDEGGLTCHAAIIAREMNKPCIVGTEIATKSLQNGDLVEIDAYHGKITKLKTKHD